MRLILAFFSFSLAASPVFAESLYVSQSGTGTGASCSAARSVSWLNTSANWANPKQAGKVGPGDVVWLCGTITSSIALQNSGATGNYLTVDGSSASLGTSVGFSTNNQSWWKIQNATWVDGATSTLANISGGSNGILSGLHADNINSGPAVFIAQSGAVRPDSITITNSYFRTAATDYGNEQHDLIDTEGSTNVVIDGNYIEMRAGGAGSLAHDDCIQTWEKGGTSGGPPGNWTIRYNWIVMNSAATNDRSWTMLENLTGTNNIYGNVFLGIQGGESANGLCVDSNDAGAIFNIYNNTFVARGGSTNNVLNLAAPGVANIRNNIFYLQGQVMSGNMTKNRSFNHWFGSNVPSCSGLTGEICGTDPLFTNYAGNDFSLQATSVDSGAATNLGAGPTGQSFDVAVIAGATWPGPGKLARSGAWNRGAIQGSASGVRPTAPTNLRITP